MKLMGESYEDWKERQAKGAIMESTKQQIADIIKELYKRYTGVEIARRIDVSVVTLYRYQNMKINKPHRRILKALRRIK